MTCVQAETKCLEVIGEMAFSEMLKKLREERHLSQKDVADYLGITRQAIASYELAKREPDYEVLRKLADYFGVSVDYLLGRLNCRDVNAFTVGKNIELIRGNLTYKELSEDISKKTGVLILPDMLELYARGERMPFVGTIKILAKYANVHDAFFYVPNTPGTYLKEKELYRMEMEQVGAHEEPGYLQAIGFMDNELRQWVMRENNIQYLRLAKELQEAGLGADALNPLVTSIKINKKAK